MGGLRAGNDTDVFELANHGIRFWISSADYHTFVDCLKGDSGS